MKITHAMSGVILGMLVMMGCADQPSTTDDQSAVAGPADATPVQVSVPSELSLSRLPDGKIDGNSFITPNACRVTLVFCQDPRFSPTLPSYCSNGCTFPNDFNAAISICKSICGHINCNSMWFLGGC